MNTNGGREPAKMDTLFLKRGSKRRAKKFLSFFHFKTKKTVSSSSMYQDGVSATLVSQYAYMSVCQDAGCTGGRCLFPVCSLLARKGCVRWGRLVLKYCTVKRRFADIRLRENTLPILPQSIRSNFIFCVYM